MYNMIDDAGASLIDIVDDYISEEYDELFIEEYLDDIEEDNN